MGVPDGAVVDHGFAHVERHAHGVEGAAGNDEPQHRAVQPGDHLVDHHDAGPAQQQIDRHPEALGDAGQAQLGEHAEQGHAPDAEDHHPAPGAVQRHQEKRRVGAGNHDEDAGVVELAQHRLALRRCEVVGRRTGEHHQQPQRVDAGGQQHGLVGVRAHHHPGAADDGQQQAGGMHRDIGAAGRNGLVMRSSDVGRHGHGVSSVWGIPQRARQP